MQQIISRQLLALGIPNQEKDQNKIFRINIIFNIYMFLFVKYDI